MTERSKPLLDYFSSLLIGYDPILIKHFQIVIIFVEQWQMCINSKSKLLEICRTEMYV